MRAYLLRELHVAKPRVEVIVINQEWCKRCGICTAFCPKKVLDEAEDGTVSVARPEACISCELCERLCPDLAIELIWGEVAS
ncbi:MAG: 4Fe-4S dicluster domain-containing protein [Alkalispirochaetaceae bacterium]